MKRELYRLAGKEFDLIIIGAGAYGSCVAWEAASRGFSVALVEKGDFCSATSANHLKMVHGGIRYLQHADVYRVRESSRERSALLKIAPHLVQPIPIALPTFGYGMEGKAILRAGLFLYDLITCDRNRGLKDPSRQLPSGRVINREKVLQLFPQLKGSKLNGAGLFYDGQYYNPPRLALAFIKSAYDAGADFCNYLEVKEFLANENRVFGIRVEDKLDGHKFDIKGRLVINTAGPWAARLLESGLGICLKPKPEFSRDLGFVISRRLTGNHALGVRIAILDPDALLSRKGRHIFLVPWRNYTLVGVWHEIHTKRPDDITVSKEELQSYLDDINGVFPEFGLELKDISMVNTGLTLFGENEPNAKNLSFGKRSLLIDHSHEHQIEGLITLVGVRATTARGMAERAIDLSIKKLGKKPVKSNTREIPIYGGDFDDFEKLFKKASSKTNNLFDSNVIQSLLHNYGAKYDDVLKYIQEDSSWAETVGDTLTIKAEIIHAVREEMAIKLGDVIFRRTDMGTGKYPNENTIQVSAEIMGNELGWSENQINSEIDELRNSLFFRN